MITATPKKKLDEVGQIPQKKVMIITLLDFFFWVTDGYCVLD